MYYKRYRIEKSGADPGGGAPGALPTPPLKLKKKYDFFA